MPKFKDKSKRNKGRSFEQPEGPIRIKSPKQGEIIGIIEQRVGGGRMLVKCTDDKERNCRVPGRLRRKLWLREGDFVIVKPWDFDNTKADVLFKYSPTAVQILRKRGMLKEL